MKLKLKMFFLQIIPVSRLDFHGNLAKYHRSKKLGKIIVQIMVINIRHGATSNDPTYVGKMGSEKPGFPA